MGIAPNNPFTKDSSPYDGDWIYWGTRNSTIAQASVIEQLLHN
jgi:hypothetical protein